MPLVLSLALHAVAIGLIALELEAETPARSDGLPEPMQATVLEPKRSEPRTRKQASKAPGAEAQRPTKTAIRQEDRRPQASEPRPVPDGSSKPVIASPPPSAPSDAKSPVERSPIQNVEPHPDLRLRSKAEEEASRKSEREAAEQAEAVARARADVEERKRVARAARAEAERNRKAQIEAAARSAAEARAREEQEKRAEAERAEQARLEAQRRAENDAREAAEAARARAQADAKAKADRLARERAEAELQAQLERESEARVAAADRAARQERERELQQQLAQEGDAHDDRRAEDEAQRWASRMIKPRIKARWLRPASATSGMSCKMRVETGPGGVVTSLSVSVCSGDAAFAKSAEAAVRKASPLPMPPDPKVAEKLRSFQITFQPD